jgi:hypothetical protein
VKTTTPGPLLSAPSITGPLFSVCDPSNNLIAERS